MHRPLFALLLLLSLGPIATFSSRSAAAIAERLDALLALEQALSDASPQERRLRIEREFDENFSTEYAPEALAKRNDEDLADLFRGAWIHAFHAADPSALAPLRAAYTEIDRRGTPSRHELLSMQRALLWHRRFDEAARLTADRSSELVSPQARPLADATTKPTQWVATGENALEQRLLAVDKGTRIVVVAQPNCGFSRRAMDAIARDSRVATLFAERATILIPPKTDIDLTAVRRWNAAHPELPMAFANAEREWPQFSSWETPVFYFLRDGKVTDTLVGWPDDARTDALLALARKRGIEPTPLARAH